MISIFVAYKIIILFLVWIKNYKIKFQKFRPSLLVYISNRYFNIKQRVILWLVDVSPLYSSSMYFVRKTKKEILCTLI